MAETSAHPTFDIPGMGRMTAADFAEAYNAGRVPAGLMAPGGSMVALPDGRGVRWIEDRTGADVRLVVGKGTMPLLAGAVPGVRFLPDGRPVQAPKVGA